MGNVHLKKHPASLVGSTGHPDRDGDAHLHLFPYLYLTGWIRAKVAQSQQNPSKDTSLCIPFPSRKVLLENEYEEMV